MDIGARQRLGAVLVTAALVAGACGDGATEFDSGTETVPAVEGSTTTTTTMVDRSDEVAALRNFVGEAPSRTCVAVGERGRATEATWFEYQADDALIPASAIKVVTGSAAIEILGADPAVVGQMMASSDNAAAEQLRAQMERDELARWLVDVGAADGTVLADGSGLSRSNRVTCRLLVALLERDAGGVIVDGLAVAGLTGTLADRYLDHPAEHVLRAKTGSISGVVALTGVYRDVVFAFIANGIGSVEEGRDLQDRLVDALCCAP